MTRYREPLSHIVTDLAVTMNRIFKIASLIWACLALSAIVAGCATQKQEKGLDTMLAQYEKTIRWSQWDAAVEFLAPGVAE